MPKVLPKIVKEPKKKNNARARITSTMEVVFDGRSRTSFLSNYFIEPDGTHVQGEFQASKCKKLSDREKFLDTTPEHAKDLGHRVKIREDWSDVKYGIMHQLVRQKFLDHPSLLSELAATGTAELIKRSHCVSSGWGMNEKREGQNQLGKILMLVRSELCHMKGK